MAYVQTRVGNADEAIDDFIPQMWAKGVNDYVSEKFVISALMDTSLSSLVSKKGDVVNIPLMGAKTAQETTPTLFTDATDNLTYHAPNDDVKQITINQLFYSAQIISDIADVQASPEYFDMYVKGMGHAIGVSVEKLVVDTITGLTVGNTVQQDLAASNQYRAADMQATLKLMAQNDLDPSDGYIMVVSPTLYGDMMGQEKFTSADYRTAVGGVDGGRGLVGSIGPMPVYVSKRMKETATNDHIAGAILKPDNGKLLYQIAPKVVSQYSVDFLGTKIAAYTACGFDFVRHGEIVTLTNLG